VAGIRDRVRRRAGVVARDTPEGAVLVDMNDGRCFELNRVGAAYWLLLEEERVLGELCARIASRFAAPAEIVERDALALTEELSRTGLVDVTPAAAP
jgi:hypothetical protein